MSVRGRRWLVVGLLCLAVHAAYLGSYALLLEPLEAGYISHDSSNQYRIPSYRSGGSAAHTVYKPAHWLDCQVRSDYWAERQRYAVGDGTFVEEVRPRGLGWPP